MVASERGAAVLTLVWAFQLIVAVDRVAGDVATTSTSGWVVLVLDALVVAGYAPTWVYLRRTRLARRLTGHVGP